LRDYERGDVKPGLECMAPLKRDRKREYVNVVVVSVSDGGHVAIVETWSSRKGKARFSFATSVLRKPGTPTPMAGVVV